MANFTDAEIKSIARRTDRNFHSENYMFIAKKIHSPLLKDFKAVHKQHMKKGYLDYELSQKRHALSESLMAELKRKNPQQYNRISRSL